MINQETRLSYAKFDHGDTRIRQAQFKYQPDWRWKYVELLRRREYRAAERLRERVAGSVEGGKMNPNPNRFNQIEHDTSRCDCDMCQFARNSAQKRVNPPSEASTTGEGDAGFLVPEAENVSSSLLTQNSPISVNGHLLYTEQNCSVFHDSDKQCPVCEGGLAVCRLCSEYEAGLDEPCRKAQLIAITIPTFEQEWQDAPKWATRYTERQVAEWWFIRGQHAKEVELLAGVNCDLKEMVSGGQRKDRAMTTAPPPDTKVQSETLEQTATNVVNQIAVGAWQYCSRQWVIGLVTEALRNERERCAQVADAVESRWIDDARNVARADDLVGSLAQSTYINYAEIANDIAKAIRKGR